VEQGSHIALLEAGKQESESTLQQKQRSFCLLPVRHVRCKFYTLELLLHAKIDGLISFMRTCCHHHHYYYFIRTHEF